MATVTGLTAARMAAIEAASVVDGAVVTNNLILTKFDGTTIDAGNVRGPTGEPAPVAAWTAPVLLNSWVNYDAATFEPAGYYLDRKRVFIKGLIMNGVATTLFNLPVGFRPPLALLLPVITDGGLNQVTINNTGDVVINAGGTNGWVSLSNLSFRID